MQRVLILLLALFAPAGAWAQASSTGQTGLVHMPDARLHSDGDWLMGISHADPYTTLWSSLRILPRLEFSIRYTRIIDTTFGGGRIKDKAFDFKFLLFDETDWRPSVVFGMQDFHGTGLFEAEYVAASKRFAVEGAGTFDLTLGYGRDRIDGLFGGLRWTTPWNERLRVVLEWDANDYPNDAYTGYTGRVTREGGLSTGLEYTWGWVNAQLSHQRGVWNGNLWLRVPLQQRTFIPHTEDPAPVTVDPEGGREALFRALADEGLNGVEVAIEGSHIRVAFSTRRYSEIGRAAGRAARAISLTAPDEARTLELTFLDYRVPLVTYRFADLALVRAYFQGRASGADLGPTLAVDYADPDRPVDGATWGDVFPDAFDGRWLFQRSPWVQGGVMTLSRNTADTGVLRFQPFRMGTYFNDSVGALRWDFFSVLEYSRWLDNNFFVNVAARITLWENVSEVQIGSTSQLPRVRSDIGEYARNTQRLGLLHAYAGFITQPAERVYAIASAGWFEQMFAGIGGELLYLPEQGNWAADVRAYGVRQRDFDGGLGFRDYDQITALASFYYRLPRLGVTLAARGGRFLAGDTGVRFEAKRRFLSNFEAGAWYTVTDANDICPWCTPNRPYRDKGLFLRVSLGAMQPRDTYAGADLSISPWTRDPGQMLRAPGNLYDHFERRLMLNVHEAGPWSGFGR